jgi:hypothetical protein
MILDLLEHGWDSPLTLVYGQRIKAELYNNTLTFVMYRHYLMSPLSQAGQDFVGLCMRLRQKFFPKVLPAIRPTCAGHQ